MAQRKKQDITIGNGSTATPILAQENDPTEAQSEQLQASTSIELGSTKPLSLAENLSLLQTICSDFRVLQCQTVILASGNILTLGIKAPASIAFTVVNGHIRINGSPVSNWKEVDK